MDESIPLHLTPEMLLQHSGWAHGLARELVSSREAAEDLVQDTWLAALEKPPTIQRSLSGWLKSALRHGAARQQISERARRGREVAAARQDAVPSTADVVERAQGHRVLVDFVLDLPEPYRSTLLLRYFEGLAPTEIAKRLGTPASTVRVHHRRAIEELRERLASIRHRDPDAWRASSAFLVGAAVSGSAKAATTGMTVGGIVMTTKAKIMGAALIASLLLVGTWSLFQTFRPDRVTPGEAGAPATSAARQKAARQNEPEPSAPILSERFNEPAAPETAPAAILPGAAAKTSVSGVVLAVDGKPVPGADVFFGLVSEFGILDSDRSVRNNIAAIAGPADARHSRIRLAKSGADGSFSFEGVTPSDRVTVGATHPDFGIVTAVGFAVREGDRRALTLRFAESTQFFGQITDAVARPIPDAAIQIGESMDGEQYGIWTNVRTDAEGRYNTARHNGKAFIVSVEADGYVGTHKAFPVSSPAERSQRLDFRLEPSPMLRGRFVLADGSPAQITSHLKEILGEIGADPPHTTPTLHASEDDPVDVPNISGTGRPGGRVIEAEDAYELRLTSPRIRYISLWMGSALLGSAAITAPPAAPDVVIDWSVAPRPRPRGIVEFVAKSAADGKPVTRFWGEVATASPEQHGRTARRVIDQRVDAPDGRFRPDWDWIRADRYRLTVKAKGFADATTTVDVKPAPAVTEVVFDLIPVGSGTGTIAGSVLDAEARPVSGAAIWVVPESPGATVPQKTGQSNAEGTFRFEDLPLGDYLVFVEPPAATKLAPAWTRARPSSDTITVRLVAGVLVSIVPKGAEAPLTYRVVDDAGIAVVDGLRTGTEHFGARYDVRLAPGRYDVQVHCPHFDPGRGEVVAAPGATVSIPLVRSKDQPGSRKLPR